jgi:protein-S-isoprenylcysteine O-methyltransferase Ste14
VRWAVALLHAAVAALVLGRSRVRKRSPRASTLLSLPAFLVAGCAFSLAAPADRWSATAQGLFLTGFLISVSALASLGRYFAFFPAVRGVTTGGPYRWLRHPAYCGELLMIAACALSLPTSLSVAVAAGAFPLVALRIRAEEALLLATEGYREYASRVRYRLVPGIW